MSGATCPLRRHLFLLCSRIRTAFGGPPLLLEVCFEFLGSFEHDIPKIAESLTVGRIVNSAFLWAGLIYLAAVVVVEVHASAFDKNIPSSIANIYVDSVISQLPVQIFEV